MNILTFFGIFALIVLILIVLFCMLLLAIVLLDELLLDGFIQVSITDYLNKKKTNST